jgi:hypothetical protein
MYSVMGSSPGGYGGRPTTLNEPFQLLGDSGMKLAAPAETTPGMARTSPSSRSKKGAGGGLVGILRSGRAISIVRSLSGSKPSLTSLRRPRLG